MIHVLDASVAIKWFAPDGDDGDAVAVRVLHDVVGHPSRFLVPELFVNEMVALFCRRLRQAGDARRAWERLARLGLRRVRLDDRLVQRSVRLAYDRRLSGYDACYVALAAELGAVWLTFDRAAHARVADLGLSRVPA